MSDDKLCKFISRREHTYTFGTLSPVFLIKINAAKAGAVTNKSPADDDIIQIIGRNKARCRSRKDKVISVAGET